MTARRLSHDEAARTPRVHPLAAACLGVLLAAALSGCARLPPLPERDAVVALAPAYDSELGRIAQQRPFADASGFHLLPTGQMALKARSDILRRAERSLDLQTYDLRNDATGRHLLRLLRDAAARGVRVRLLVDDLYTAGVEPLLHGLDAHENVEVRLFNPFTGHRGGVLKRFASSLSDIGRLEHRMHNKLLVADGVTALVGGRNLADEYFMQQPGDNFVDLEVFVAGAVVPTLSGLFDLYWNSEYTRSLAQVSPPSRPRDERRSAFEATTAGAGAREPQGPVDMFGQRGLYDAEGRLSPLIWASARAFADHPAAIVRQDRRLAGPDSPGVGQRLAARMASARREVLATSPYLVPDDDTRRLVRSLVERGVRVSLLTNSLAATDEPIVHFGYRRHREKMVRNGVELFELAPVRIERGLGFHARGDAIGRLHAKAAVIDREVVFIGSLNFDPRSASQNTELGLLIDSPELAHQTAWLIEQLQHYGARRLRWSTELERLEWIAQRDDGSEVALPEPETDWWRSLMLELLGPWVPEGVL